MFESPVAIKKFTHKGWDYTAKKYKNGTINIHGIKFAMHSFTSAIKTFKRKYR